MLASLVFLPTSLFLFNSPINKKTKKKIITTLVIVSLLIFNVRNIKRIDKELKVYNSNSFPFFYIPRVDFKTINTDKGINVYAPIDEACWAIKTPCVGGIETIDIKKIFGFTVFLDKYK